MFPLHHLTIIIDHCGKVEGAGAVTEHADGSKTIWPFRPGPFDTPEDVLAEIKQRAGLQMTLW